MGIVAVFMWDDCSCVMHHIILNTLPPRGLDPLSPTPCSLDPIIPNTLLPRPYHPKHPAP